MSKRTCLLLLLVLTASGLVRIMPAHGSIPKPSVPEFTVKLVAHPYDVPPTTTTTIDQYTGKETVITHPGYRVENKSIEITVKNQPFTPYADADGHEINLYYNVRVKGHFGQDWDWKELYPYEATRNGEFGTYHQNPSQSNSRYTVVSCPAEYSDHALVDFQVQALEGFYTEWSPFTAIPITTWQFTGKSSDWSNTTTLAIGTGDTTTSPNTLPSQNNFLPDPSQSPSQNPATSTTDQSGNQTDQTVDQPTSQANFYGIVVVVIVVLAAGLGLLVYVKKQKTLRERQRQES